MATSFNLIKEQNISEIGGTAKLYVHEPTGARLLSLVNDDENKVFSINFRTTPNDSTGVAHVLEHSVLCGSKKYPVKKQLVAMQDGSLATYVNALTYPDKTCYPIASQNAQDFYNLIDMYMDAVFHPLLDEQTFMQEGWHYELEAIDKPLSFKGVVLNEMKGAYSWPEGLLEETIQQSLFQNHTYGVDSGGNPRNIPTLTYTALKSFHETYYHPSNSFIFFYGNDDPEKRLNLMEDYLKSYEKRIVNSQVPLATPFESPKNIQYAYDAGQDKDIKNKHYLTVNWLLPNTSDPVLDFSLQILASILTGMSASPLKNALIDSGLGEDLAGVGLETELRQHFFSTGLKGTHARDAKKIEALIFETLRTLVADGIDPAMITAAINTIEFNLRENNTGSFPRGIALMLRALSTWLHDDDPIKLLAFDPPLNEIKSRVASDKRYFENLIQTYLLDNVHRTTIRCKPDSGLGHRLDEEEKTRLGLAGRDLTREQLQEIVENTEQLKKRQETPDTPEALATIPVLKLADLEKKSNTIPIEILPFQNTQILYHELLTNGIVYLDLGFDLHTLSSELIPLAELFGSALFEIGTATEDYIKLSQRIGINTGGMRVVSVSVSSLEPGKNVAKLFVRAKAMAGQSAEMLNILRDVLLTAKFDNRDRLKQIVLEEIASLESDLVPNGDQFVADRLCAQLGESGWTTDQMKGIGYLFALRKLEKEIDTDWHLLLTKLESIRSTLINRNGMICNVTVDSGNWQIFKPQLDSFLSALPSKDAQFSAFNIQLSTQQEGLTIPALVNYVGKGASLYELGYRYHGSVEVITGYLDMAYLWDKIRVEGGAYGASVQFDDRSGVLTYLSYRDPNVAATIDSYDESAAFLKELDSLRLTDNELNKSIIGAIGELDAYQLPDAKGFTSMMRYLTGRTDAWRQKQREEVLSTNRGHFIAFAEILEKAASSGGIVVLGSETAIRSANLGLEVIKVN